MWRGPSTRPEALPAPEVKLRPRGLSSGSIVGGRRMTARPTIAFDLDGTLVDTAPDLVATLNLVLQEAGLDQVPYDEARNLVGGGARALIERGLAFEHERLPAAKVDGLLARFLVHYEAHLADRSRAFPDVGAVLDVLAAKGALLIVCTNKLERFSVKLLQALG